VTRAGLLVLAGLLVSTAPLSAQRPDSLVASGIRAYRDLDLDAAAGFLSRASLLLEGRPDTALRTSALLYLGATEIYRGRGDSARALFRRLVRLDPGYRVDRLIFPPEVTTVFDAARRATPAVWGRFASESRFAAGTAGFTTTLVASTFHQIRVELQRPDASVARSLYSGPIADSLTLSWDGWIAEDQPAATGRYLLAITSLDSAGTAGRILRVPLQVSNLGADTVATPPLPADQFLPEQRRGGGGMESLLGGLLAGTVTALAPVAIASDASLSGGRFVVGGAIVALGVAGFVMGRGERPIPENIAANDSVRAEWRRRVEAVGAENARRRAEATLIVRVGTPQVIEQEHR